MDNIYRVTFIGHRTVENILDVEACLYETISNMVREKDVVEFYIGRNGEFDILAASVIKLVKKSIRADNNFLILVLPYLVSDIEYYEKYYDEVLIPDELNQFHYKSAIHERNRWMLNKADLLIAYVRHTGNAMNLLSEAKAIKKNINLI